MNRRQPLVRLTSFGLGLLLLSVSGLGFWITEVRTLPANAVTYGDESVLQIAVLTGVHPTYVYQPTEVVSSNNTFLIRLFLTRPEEWQNRQSAHTETASLGYLPIGQYKYQIQLFTNPKTNSPLTNVFGAFSVAPPLKFKASLTNIVVRWPGVATNFVLQIASGLSLGAIWTNVSAQPYRMGDELVVTNRIEGGNRFFRLLQNNER